jgi:hypothetical protein
MAYLLSMGENELKRLATNRLLGIQKIVRLHLNADEGYYRGYASDYLNYGELNAL